jgi:hypothetical protein
MPKTISEAAKISAHIFARFRNSNVSTKVAMTTSRQRIGFSIPRSVEEKRRGNRQRSFGDIWVDPGELATPIFCKVLDISHGGARLMVQGDSVLPDTFVMCMATSKRFAKVMWRSGQEVGVEFEKSRNKPAPRSEPTPEPAAEPSQAPSALSPPVARVDREDSSDQPPAIETMAREDGDRLNAALERLRRRMETIKTH